MALVWGIPYLLIKVAVGDLSPISLVFVRTGIGALLLVPLAGAWLERATLAGPKQAGALDKLEKYFWASSFTTNFDQGGASQANAKKTTGKPHCRLVGCGTRGVLLRTAMGQFIIFVFIF